MRAKKVPGIKAYVACALVGATLASCARIGGPITEVQPGIFRITHSMGPSSPVKGVRQGVINRATAKCEKTGQSYTKLREEMTTSGTLDYTLFFQCVNAESK